MANNYSFAKKFKDIFFWLLIVSVFPVRAQDVQYPVQIDCGLPKVVNFSELANWELSHPPSRKRRHIEQGEEREKNGNFIPQPIPADAIVSDFKAAEEKLDGAGQRIQSNAPVTSFNGTLDNGTLIPPDIRGAVGTNYFMETTNQEFKVYQKTGTLVSTLSINTFFTGSSGSSGSYFDPHIAYDPTNDRWIVCIAGDIASNTHSGLFLAVSQTGNPTGSWWLYSVDATGNTSDFMDYPLLGFNNNWIVITGRNFLASGTVRPTIFTWNRATVYAGGAATASSFTDATNSLTLAPAVTYDNTQSTEYLVCNWNGNSGGNGYVRLSAITGTPSAPVYTSGATIGVSNPWADNASLTYSASQLGTANKVESGDTRIGNAVYANGSLWFAHTAYLPATSATRSAVDWWQVNPATSTVQQFGRIDSALTGTYNYYPSIAVNPAGDVLVAYFHSSTTTYPSAAYSFHAATDGAGTMQSMYIYKNGLASYYKTFGSGRNRFGDYSGAAWDYTDNSLWCVGEWAQTGNNWGTAIAKVGASSVAVLTSITTLPFTTNAFCAGSSVNVAYSVYGPANAGNIFTAQLSDAAGSFANPVAIGTLTAVGSGTIVATIPAGTASGTGYRIRVVSSSPVVVGSDNGTNISISAQLAAAASITGPSSVCASTTGIAFSIPAIANATSYIWTLPTGFTIATGSTTNSITVDIAANAVNGAITVRGSNANCSGAITTLNVTVNAKPVVTLTSASGCVGTPIVLNKGLPAGGTYSVPNPYSGSSTAYTYTYTDANGCSATSSASTIFVNALPVVTAQNAVTCAGTPVSLSGSPAGGVFSVANPYNGPATTFTYSYTNANGCSATSAAASIFVNDVPVATAQNAVTCSGTPVQLSGSPAGGVFSVPNPYTGASTTFTYSITSPNGCTGVSAPASIQVNPLPVATAKATATCAGTPVQLVGTPAGGTFSVANPYAGASTSYTYSYTDANGCTGVSDPAAITVNPLPVVQAGNVDVCEGNAVLLVGSPAGGIFSEASPYTGPSKQYTYSYTDANGCSNSGTGQITTHPLPVVTSSGLAASYQLNDPAVTLTGSPAGGVFSGPGVTGATFSPAAAGGGGPYTVTYTYTDAFGCSNSSVQTTTVSGCVNPATPGTITATGGNTKVCPGSTKKYSIAAVVGATSYLWTPPVGATVTVGQGTTSVTVVYGVGFVASDTLKVAAVNSCGTSANNFLKITRNTPSIPSVINGLTYGVCNQPAVSYSVTAVSGMTYNWSFTTAGASIATGQGTNAVTAAFTAAFSAGYIQVTASNNCGTSAARQLNLHAVPAKPVSISGPTSVCANQAGVAYSTPAVTNAATYTWGGPTGSRISDGTVTSTSNSLVTTATAVTVKFATTAGAVKVRANSACGSSLYLSLNVSMPCRLGENPLSEIVLEPNPAGNEVQLNFSAVKAGTGVIRILDLLGKEVQRTVVELTEGENSFNLSLAAFTEGIYLVAVDAEGKTSVQRLVINKD